MRILSEYLISRLLGAYLVATLAIGALLWLLEVLQRLEDGLSGAGSLLQIVFGALQILPEGLIDLLPVITVLATAAAMGGLQASSELTIMRAAGVSIWRLTAVAMMPGVMVAVLALAALQWVTPWIQQGPERLIGASLGESGLWHPAHGLWLRQEQEFLNVQDLRLGRIPTGINLYQFSDTGALEQHFQAESATIQGDGRWRLEEVVHRDFRPGGVEPLRRVDELLWDSFLPARQLELLLSPPASLPLSDLWQYVDGLKARGQEFAEFDMVLWRRLSLPLACLGMVLAAMATAAVPLKSRLVSVRLVAALTLGLGFQLLAELSSYLALVLGWLVVPVALAPPLLLSILAWWMLRRAR